MELYTLISMKRMYASARVISPEQIRNGHIGVIIIFSSKLFNQPGDRVGFLNMGEMAAFRY